MALIIVESPTKARTFNRILKGQDYFVFATMGHFRDLPSKSMSIDFEHDFKPDYQIVGNKQKIVDELKKLAKNNKEIIFATDPDREGEAISYHAAHVLGMVKDKWPELKMDEDNPLKRIVFHEITQRALKEALENPETIRWDLVKAQQARRILDRIVGYELSPLLWDKMGKNWLSAGRVQTVALRLIVEREKEIRTFKIEDYFQIYGNFESKESIRAKLVSKDGVAYEKKTILKLFAGDYEFAKTAIVSTNVEDIKKDVEADKYTVVSIKEEIKPKYPPPPFTTSLLQQESFHKFSFSSKMTMRIAQDLYERGLITYHRTDSFNLSTHFVFAAKDYIEKTFGKEYALEKPRGYKTKSKLAQEAHEAIRPTKLDVSVDSINVDKKITQNHKKVYKLIFERALSTQMKEAQVKHVDIIIDGKKGYRFLSEMQEVVFDGFLKVLNPEFVNKNKVVIIPKEGESLKLETLELQDSKTNPPPRYNDATLIKILEEKGIGRPSTYASIISLIQDKNYVEKQFRNFSPNKLGEAISDYLSEAFPDIFSLDFTAGIEEHLDQIAEGQEDMIKVLRDFFEPFQVHLKVMKKDKKKIDVEEIVEEKCEKCKSQMVVRFSKFGKFMACSKYPACKFTKPFLHFVNGKFCPECNGKLTVIFTKSRKKFYGCENYPKCKYSSWTLKPTTKTTDVKLASKV